MVEELTDDNMLSRVGLLSHQQKIILELEKTQKDFWNIARSSANFLNMLIKISDSKNIVEVGTSNGYSGIWMAKALKKEFGGTGGKLTTIEYYEKRIVLAQENFKKCQVDDVITILQGSATEVLETIEGEFDFAFIDANKAEYVKYFDLINPKLKKGGIITADNITSHPEKVATFVEKIQSDPNYQVEILDMPAGMLLAYKLT